ncbi:MAG: polyhydroxybutyrate depolymerase [Planctomycetia bacterium]|nr:polyhydroxybutyrate depolymerase [Planctomycetia bacterium]
MSTTTFTATRLDVPSAARLRHAIACVPDAPPPAAGWPLVLAFHGGQSHPEMMRRFSGLDIFAASGRAIVVYPAGTGSREGLLTWNGGNCCGEARDQDSDDVAFARAVIADVAARHPIDRRRIHATGMSNGAMMAYRVAAELATMIASIAPVAGPLALTDVAPVRPVSVLHFHGTLDQFTPLEGGVGRRSVTRVSHRPVVEGLLDWVRADGCPAEPIREAVPCPDADLSIERFTWGPGKEWSEVVFYRIEGGGHVWPGRTPDSFLLGPAVPSLDANTLIWEFFARHPLHV